MVNRVIRDRKQAAFTADCFFCYDLVVKDIFDWLSSAFFEEAKINQRNIGIGRHL